MWAATSHSQFLLLVDSVFLKLFLNDDDGPDDIVIVVMFAAKLVTKICLLLTSLGGCEAPGVL